MRDTNKGVVESAMHDRSTVSVLVDPRVNHLQTAPSLASVLCNLYTDSTMMTQNFLDHGLFAVYTWQDGVLAHATRVL